MTEQPDTGKNSGQFEFWNSASGEKWVANQVALDRHLSALTDRLFHYNAIQPGERIIDIGCGTGTTALRAAAATGPDGAVLGIDLSHPMLGLARRRAETQGGVTNLTLEIADAQSHAFEPGAFDLLQSRFGVMFFEDPTAAFANLRTALRPGGRLCFVCWGALADNPWFSIPRAAAIRHLGEPEAEPPRAPGPMAFAETDYVAGILNGAGFKDIDIKAETCDLIGASNIAETAAFALNVGPASRLIRLHDPAPAIIAAIRTDIEQALAPYDGAGGIKVPARLNFVRARQP
ncbi:MAG: methyltransferase domain-containing protein [Proteobacteria bacterium]|nr:methyltransferase domain-containing protein [Pseudomonadota bacterium]